MRAPSNGSGHNAMDTKFKDTVQGNLFQFTVTAPTVLWLILFGLFISFGVGWDNLFDLLPHEIGAVFLSFIAPILFFIVIYIVVGTAKEVRQVADDSHHHGELIRALLVKTGPSGGAAERDDQWLADALDAQKSAADAMTDIVNAHRALSEDINDKLTAYIQGEQAGAGKSGGPGPDDISQTTALMGLVNIVLNDLSVSSTRILVRLLELENLSKEEIKDLMQGLIGAYSAGDKDVFFRILHQQLAAKPECVDTLRSHTGEGSAVSRDLSRILRGSKEVFSLVERCDEGDIIGIVFDNNDLKALRDILASHFVADGTAKVPFAAPEPGVTRVALRVSRVGE